MTMKYSEHHTPVCNVKAGQIFRLSQLLFPRPIRLVLDPVLNKRIKDIAIELYSHPKTNPRGKSLEQYFRDSIGFYVETAIARKISDPNYLPPLGIDFRDVRTYGWDVTRGEVKIEIKSITDNFENHLHASYNEESLNTFKKNVEYIDYVIFGNAANRYTMFDDGYVDVEVRWIINAKMFAMDCYVDIDRVRDDLHYRRWAPHGNQQRKHRMREKDACAWNPIIDIEDDSEWTTRRNASLLRSLESA